MNMVDLRQLHEKFRDEEQCSAVREIVRSRLADDRNQEECRYVMRFWWQLIMSYREVGFDELEEYLSPEKFAIVRELIEATDHSYGAIDKWIHKYSLEIPVIKDNGFRYYESDDA